MTPVSYERGAPVTPRYPKSALDFLLTHGCFPPAWPVPAKLLIGLIVLLVRLNTLLTGLNTLRVRLSALLIRLNALLIRPNILPPVLAKLLVGAPDTQYITCKSVEKQFEPRYFRRAYHGACWTRPISCGVGPRTIFITPPQLE